MPIYVTDTHPLIWHLTGDSRLRGHVQAIFDEADRGIHTIWIPSIVLVEVVYISEKKGIVPAGGTPFLNLLAASPNCLVDPLDLRTLQAMQSIPRSAITGMPDRIIAATSLKLGVPLITADDIIRGSGLVPVV